jgi:hypothetical protein
MELMKDTANKLTSKKKDNHIMKVNSIIISITDKVHIILMMVHIIRVVLKKVMNTARVITIIQKRIRPGLENLIKTEKNKEVDGLMVN